MAIDFIFRTKEEWEGKTFWERDILELDKDFEELAGYRKTSLYYNHYATFLKKACSIEFNSHIEENQLDQIANEISEYSWEKWNKERKKHDRPVSKEEKAQLEKLFRFLSNKDEEILIQVGY